MTGMEPEAAPGKEPGPRSSPQTFIQRQVHFRGLGDNFSSLIADCLGADPWQSIHGTFTIHDDPLSTQPEFDGDLVGKSIVVFSLHSAADVPELERFRDKNPLLPIVALMELADVGLAQAAMQAGADECLCGNELTTSALPRGMRAAVAHRQQLQLQQRLLNSLAEYHAAQAIQQRLLPQTCPRLPGADIAGLCIPAETIGGDLFDFLYHDQERCVGAVADVSGHGLPAAILMTELHGLLHGLVDQNLDLVHIAASANHRVLEASRCFQFITMLLYQLDLRRHLFTYISAGHPGWILRTDGERIELHSRQLPLGIDADIPEYRLLECSLRPGDVILLPTDGAFEMLSPTEEMFGVERLLQLVERNAHRSAQAIVDRAVAGICEFCDCTQLADDCTIVLIKIEA